jgi:DNA invertase Pin-like site-specific DNA recombinase
LSRQEDNHHPAESDLEITYRPLVGIVRVSAKHGRGGDSFISPAVQREGMQDWIDRHPDYELPDDLVFEELDVSGARPLAKRPGLSRAVELVESGEAAGVIGIRLDRLARSPAVWDDLRSRVRAAGGVVVAVDHGGVRGDSPEEELVDDVNMGFAKYEVTRARRTFHLARERAVERGVAPFAAPVGYDKIASDDDPRGVKGALVPNADAPAVRAAFEARAAGAALNAVAALLDERGVRTTAGRPRYSKGWSRTGVASLLKNRTYVGELRAGPFLNAHAHEPIIDEALFLACQKPAPRMFTGRESSFPFLLTKITRCAGCGAAMVGSHVHPRPGTSYPFYRCVTRGCPQQASITAKRLEAFVLALLRERTPDVVEHDDQPIDDEGDALEAEREEAQRQLDAWRALNVADIDPAFFTEGLRERRERLDVALEAIGRRNALATRPQTPLSVDLWNDWETMSTEAKRTVVRSALDRVEVRKGKTQTPLDERIFVTFAE